MSFVMCYKVNAFDVSHLFWTLILSLAFSDEVKKILNNSLHLPTAHALVTISVEDPER